jgi:hypothetical protein
LATCSFNLKCLFWNQPNSGPSTVRKVSTTNAQSSWLHRCLHAYNALQPIATIYERKLTALNDLKNPLLHQAFSGEL